MTQILKLGPAMSNDGLGNQGHYTCMTVHGVPHPNPDIAIH